MQLAQIFYFLRWERLPPRAILHDVLCRLRGYCSQIPRAFLVLVHECMQRLARDATLPEYLGTSSFADLDKHPSYYVDLGSLSMEHWTALLQHVVRDATSQAVRQQRALQAVLKVLQVHADCTWADNDDIAGTSSPVGISAVLCIKALYDTYVQRPQVAHGILVDQLKSILSQWATQFDFDFLHRELRPVWLQYLNLPKVGVPHCDIVTDATMVYHVVRPVIHAEAAGPHFLWRNWAVTEYQNWLHDQYSANLLALLSRGLEVHVQEQPLRRGGEVVGGMQRMSLSDPIGPAVGTVPGRASKAMVATALLFPVYPQLVSQDAPVSPRDS